MLTLHDLGMRFGGKILFENASLQLNPNRKYGLVGANGSGKTTLLKMLLNEATPDKGEISRPRNQSMGAMKQDHYLYDKMSLISTVLYGKPELGKAMDAKHKLLEETIEFDEEACAKLEVLEAQIDKLGGYTAESDAAKLLEGLGLPAARHDKPMNLLSGGYKLRVLLAQLLFAQHDLLLLDEPTNHLDIFTIRWLEGFLKDYEGTLVVISHDRTFLNAVCTDILDVDHGTITHYPGNYDAFVEAKNLQHLIEEKHVLKQEKKRDHLMNFVERFGAKASKARQAQSKMHLVDKLNDELESAHRQPSSRKAPHLRFDVKRQSGQRVLKVNALSKSYGEHQVLRNVEFEIERGEKVAFVGANGIGKTTLLEIINQNIQANAGDFAWGINAEVAYFPQDPRKALPMDQTPLEWICSIDRRISEGEMRAILAKVLFEGDEVHQRIDTLSGGEMARLLLAKMLVLKCNVLIFDEPTNHLDMESIEALLGALNDYPGTVLLVSHNRYFVQAFANRVIEIQSEGVADYKYTYDEYIQRRDYDLLSKEQKTPSVKKAASPAVPISNESRKKRSQLERQIALLEEESTKLEKQMLELDKAMINEEFFKKPAQEQQSVLKDKQRLEAELEKVLAQWEKLSEELSNL